MFRRPFRPHPCLVSLILVRRWLTCHGQSGVGSVDFGSHLCTSWNTISWMDYLTHCISHCVNSLGAFLLDAFVLVAKVSGVSLQFITNALAWSNRLHTLPVEFIKLLRAFGVEVAREIRLELLNILIWPSSYKFGINHNIRLVDTHQVILWLVASFIRKYEGILALFS